MTRGKVKGAATDRLLTYDQAAALIERSRVRVVQLVATGKLPVERFEGGRVRIRESAVRAYLAKREIPDALPFEPGALMAA